MLISKAYAQAVDISSEGVSIAAIDAGQSLMWNMGMIVALVVLFYFLLIMPQQKRFKEHSEMLSGLKKGDKIVTGGGLIGKVDKITEGDNEVVIDLGDGMKVTALRSTIHERSDPRISTANDSAGKSKKAK